VSAANGAPAPGLSRATVVALVIACACSSAHTRETLAAQKSGDPRIEEACAMTAKTCSRCHDLGKLYVTHFDSSLPWRQLVLRMRLMPGSGITDAEVHAAETCLVYHDLGQRGLDELAALSEQP
jgi:hypothetical protein